MTATFRVATSTDLKSQFKHLAENYQTILYIPDDELGGPQELAVCLLSKNILSLEFRNFNSMSSNIVRGTVPNSQQYGHRTYHVSRYGSQGFISALI